MNKSNIKKSKAFTLLELLIATTIFAIVMMMALGAITDSANYLAKLKAMRVSSEESRRIADILGEDIKKANTELSVTFNDSNGTTQTGVLYKSGIALFDCDSVALKCGPKHSDLTTISTSDSLASEFKANTLVLAEKDNSGNLVYKVYYNDSVSTDKMLYYAEVKGQTTLDLTDVNNIKKNGNEISGGSVPDLDLMNDVVINFGGYAPTSKVMETAANRQQAYVFYNINVKTRGALKQQELFDINVLSGTTSRNYN